MQTCYLLDKLSVKRIKRGREVLTDTEQTVFFINRERYDLPRFPRTVSCLCYPTKKMTFPVELQHTVLTGRINEYILIGNRYIQYIGDQRFVRQFQRNVFDGFYLVCYFHLTGSKVFCRQIDLKQLTGRLFRFASGTNKNGCHEPEQYLFHTLFFRQK